MVESRHAEAVSGLYERLLQRLAVALQGADSASSLHREVPEELELNGLSPAELELIHAYLEGDLHWLRGWHAAAEELALIDHSAPALNKMSRVASRPVSRGRFIANKYQRLHCALCGTLVPIQRGCGVPPCVVCGSRLFCSGPLR